MKDKLFTIVAWVGISIVLATSCVKSSPEEQAALAAKEYYECLLKGDAEGLVSAKADADSLPDSYRRMLVMAYRQYLSDINSKHGGLHAIAVSENVARRDSTKGVTYAFLLLSFNDSTREEISVPMVEQDGRWYVK